MNPLLSNTRSARATISRGRQRFGAEVTYRAWSQLTREGRDNVERVRSLAGRYAGRRAVVMGNGPSLRETDLEQFAADVTLVSNAHYLIWNEMSYVPTFLAVEDRLVAEDRSRELAHLAGRTTSVFPFEFRNLIGEATPDRLYLNFRRLYGSWPKFSHHLHSRAYWGGTVTYLNLQLASYLGCNPIMLVGCDHSYAIRESDERSGVIIMSTTSDINHMHPDYFGPGYRWHDPNVARMEAAYEHARDVLGREGVRVLNATVGGHLEVFPRVAVAKRGK